MPRFWRVLFGPRVTVRPHVTSGPASPGQQVWIGRRVRSTSLPSHTISWHGGELTVFGAMSHTAFASDSSFARVLQTLRRLRFLQRGQQPSDVAQRFERGGIAEQAGIVRALRVRFDTHAERHPPRRAEQVGEHGNRVPGRASNSNAGPPERNTRSESSVISRTGETDWLMRRNSPSPSRRAVKSRRSLYFIDVRRGRAARKTIVDFTCVGVRTFADIRQIPIEIAATACVQDPKQCSL